MNVYAWIVLVALVGEFLLSVVTSAAPPTISAEEVLTKSRRDG